MRAIIAALMEDSLSALFMHPYNKWGYFNLTLGALSTRGFNNSWVFSAFPAYPARKLSQLSQLMFILFTPHYDKHEEFYPSTDETLFENCWALHNQVCKRSLQPTTVDC